VDGEYLDLEAEQGDTSREKVSVSMRKTEKRPLRKRVPEEEHE
jgi:hypothetical protein